MRNLFRSLAFTAFCALLPAASFADNLTPATSIIFAAPTAGVVLKQGGNGLVGTFVCTSGGSIVVANTNVAISDAIIISENTAGGTISTPPAVKTVTAGTGFTALCATSDTATYNYAIIKNAP